MLGSAIPRWWVSFVSTVSGLALFAGFERAAAAPAAPAERSHTTGTTGWNAAPGRPREPGLGQATIHWHAREGRLVYVLWSDLPGGPGRASSSGLAAAPGARRQHARLLASDGRRLDLSYEQDPRTGRELVRCGGARFDLAGGRLLVASGQGSEATAAQLPLPPALAGLLSDAGARESELRRRLQEYAARDPDLRSYFRRPERP